MNKKTNCREEFLIKCQDCNKNDIRYIVFNTENNEYYYLCDKCLMSFDEIIETFKN